MTEEEEAELLEIFRRDDSEAPPVNARGLVAVYLTLLEDGRRGGQSIAESVRTLAPTARFRKAPRKRWSLKQSP